MAQPGRKRKPNEIRILEGNPGHRPIPESPQSAPADIEPPGYLHGPGLDEWNKKAPELSRLGILTVLNKTLLAMYCEMYGQWEQLVDTGEFDKANRLVKELRMLSNEFGMSPASISKMPIKPDESDGGDWD